MKYCSSLLIMLVLVGCSGQQEDDIDQFIKGPVVGARGKVDPLPEVKQFVPYVFNADSTLPDPFAPRKANVEKSKEDCSRILNAPRKPWRPLRWKI